MPAHGLCAGRFFSFCALILCVLSAPANAAPFAYIPCNGGTVLIIDIATNTVVGTVGVGSGPFGVAVHPDGTRVYVGNQGSISVSVIDTSTNTVVATVPMAPLGSSPSGIAVHPDGTKVYVATAANNVLVIDTASNTVLTAVPVGTNPQGVAVNFSGTRVYVANFDSNNVSVIDVATNTVIATVGVGSGPNGIALSSVSAYVANTFSNTVSEILLSTNIVNSTKSVGTNPFGVAVDLIGPRIYAANFTSNNVSAINFTTVPVGTNPIGLAVDPSFTRVYVANNFSSNVSVIAIASNTVIATIDVGCSPTAFGLFIGGPLPPTITNGPPPDGPRGVVYDFTFTSTRSPTFSVTTGSLPTGLTLSSAGVISGTPTTGGTYTGTVTATNGTAPDATQDFSITISIPPPPTFTNGPPPGGTVGVAFNFAYTTTGSPTLSVTTGSLPSGLSLSSGAITGTPTTKGTFTGTVTATNGSAPDATQDFSIMINERGDANGDGALNPTDIFYLISYLFTAGPPPPTVPAGDANHNGSTDVPDIFFLIAYFFTGGPAPS